VAEAEAELAAAAKLGAHLLIGSDPDFPRLLAVLDPPAPLIWTLGDVSTLRRRTVAIVGAREASAAGQRMAGALAAALGAGGYIVVSGLARGIDAAAHKGALASGTVAVLAGGVDSVWPPQNADLYEAIREKGCIVSERPIGYEGRAPDFPRRNRLISGLSLGVVVVEAELRSGSLITARLAAEQSREVFAVPGSPLDPRARGANDLIRQGAYLVEDADDILRILDSQAGVSDSDGPDFSDTDRQGDMESDGLANQLETLLSPTPTSLDILAREAHAPVSAIAAALIELTIAGRAELLPGGLAISL
jgi:DNA processing protein